MMDGTTLKIAFIFLFFSQALSSLQSDKMGPFTMNIKHVEDCGNEDALLRFHLRSRKMSRTSITIEGHLTITPAPVQNITGFNDDFRMRIIWNKFTPTGWKDNFLILDWSDKGACSSLLRLLTKEDKENIFKGFRDENDAPVSPKCPLPWGNFTMRGIELNCEGISETLPKAFFYGSYRAKTVFHHLDFPDVTSGCMAWYFDIVPKRKRSGK